MKTIILEVELDDNIIIEGIFGTDLKSDGSVYHFSIKRVIGRCNNCRHGQASTPQDLKGINTAPTSIRCGRRTFDIKYKEPDDLCKYWKGLKK